jgi:hypothetical protein
MRTRIILSTLALATLVTGVAHADDAESGSYGLGDYMTLGFQGFGMSTDTVLADPAAGGAVSPVTLDGYAGILRFNAGGYMRKTRFGSFAGLEFSMGLGWIDKAAIVRDETQLEDMTWGRLYLDMEGGLSILVLERFDVLGMFHLRASIQGGVGFSSDSSYVYTGARVATSLLGSLEGEATYAFRYGNSYAGADETEHRVGAQLVFGQAGWGVGGELWLGDQRLMGDPTGSGTLTEQPTPGRAFKGEYRVLMLAVTKRWR